MKTCLIEVSHWHASMYAAQLQGSGHELAAVSDQDGERAEAFAQPYGARVYTDYHEMLEQERPDFVMALGRHCDMTQTAADLVEAGVPFLMEKPMGTDWPALDQVAAKAEARGLHAGVTLQYRLSPAVRELVRRREQGSLGQLMAYYFRLLAGEPERYRQWGVPWVLSKREAGGGPLYNFGPHGIDLFLLLAGEPVAQVQCVKSHGLHGLEVEDFASLTLTTESGRIGVVQVGYVCPQSAYDFDFSLCTSQLVVKDCNLSTGLILERDGGETKIEEPGGGPSYLEDALRRLASGHPPLAPVRQMVEILRVINAAEGGEIPMMEKLGEEVGPCP